MALYWILGIGGFCLFLVILLYNRIVALQQQRRSAFSDIDVQLKARHDLIPNLVATVKGYAAHEKDVLDQVTSARASAMRQDVRIGQDMQDMQGMAAAEAALGQAMMKVLAVAENYPELKADRNFQHLQTEMSDIENKIAAARRFFNNTTNEYNTAIRQFPAVFIARAFGFSEESYFELDAAESQAVHTAPKVSF